MTQGFPLIDILEYPANFESFDKPKTIENVVSWLNSSRDSVKVNASDINQMAADGASNAIGSVLELEARNRFDRSNDVDLSICIAHQNERAGGYASGTHEYAEPVNLPLGIILNKSHGIQVRLNRASSR